MPAEQFARTAEPYIRQAVKNPAIDPAEIAALLQQRTEVLTEIPEKLDFLRRPAGLRHERSSPTRNPRPTENATLMWPVRIAASGRLVTPGGAVEICHILGKEETLRRLRFRHQAKRETGECPSLLRFK
jgi:glutamyl-tRNA synthetase